MSGNSPLSSGQWTAFGEFRTLAQLRTMPETRWKPDIGVGERERCDLASPNCDGSPKPLQKGGAVNVMR